MPFISTPYRQYSNYLLLFIILTALGFCLSARKPLWTDEIFTQVASIDPHPYSDILASRLEGEDNLCPLYYVLQKAVCDVTGYRFAQTWDGVWSFSDREGQMTMRAASIVFMAAAVTGLAVWAGGQWGLAGALAAVVLALSSAMFWIYGPEARPYALWFLLSLGQLAVWIKVIDRDSSHPRWSWMLLGIHTLLASTILFSTGQIVWASVLAGIIRRDWKITAATAALPLAACAYFLSRSLGMDWWTGWPPVASGGEGTGPVFSSAAVLTALGELNKAAPLELIIFIIGMLVVVLRMKREASSQKGEQYLPALLVFTAGLWFYALTIIAVFMLFTSKSAGGAAVQDRYFVFLTPAVLAATLSSAAFLYRHADSGRRVAWLLIFSGLWALIAVRTVLNVTAMGLY